MPLDHVSMFAVSGHTSNVLHSDTMLRVQAVAINGRPHNSWPCKVWSDGPVADDLAALGFFVRNQRRREPTVATYLTYVTLLRTSCVYRTSEGALTMNLKDHDCAADFTLL